LYLRLPSLVSKVQKASSPGHKIWTLFFGFVTFVPLVSSPKQLMLVLSMSFYHQYFSRYRKHLHRTVFRVVAFVSVISSSKQTPSILAPFFYRT
jgi:hypothetical protein